MRHARCMRSRCSRGRGLSACGSAVCELTPRRLPHCPAGAEVCGRDALVLQPLALDLGVRQLLGQVVAVLDHAGDLPVALPQPGPAPLQLRGRSLVGLLGGCHAAAQVSHLPLQGCGPRGHSSELALFSKIYRSHKQDRAHGHLMQPVWLALVHDTGPEYMCCN